MSASVCGLDVHKDSTYATTLYCDGRIVSQRRMVNDKVLSYLSAYQISRIKIKEIPTSGTTYGWDGEIYLKAGDYVRCYVYNATAGNAFCLFIFGAKLRAE